VYGERVWFECASVASVESAPWSAGRSTIRASVSALGLALMLMLMLAIDARRVRSRGAGGKAKLRSRVV
jgi:ABC-type Fe3+ transport system permease subunit